MLPFLNFTGAACAAALAIVVGLRAHRTTSSWFFVAGMALFAFEGVCVGMAARATTALAVADWQSLAIVTRSLMPFVWLCFSLAFARGNAEEFLLRWRFALAASLIIPVTVAIGFYDEVIFAVARPEAQIEWIIQLGRPGVLLNVLLLVAILTILVNLERTFRATVGTMRWRIKYMVLGLGVLLVVRAYYASQIVLFGAVDMTLQGLNSAALIFASLLIVRSLLRAGHFDVNVYPSHAILQNSVTIVFAGAYLIIVGLLAKLFRGVGGESSLQIQALIVLLALVFLAVVLASDKVRLRTRHFVSRHFQRPIYDYRSVWKTFTDGTARLVEQSDLCLATSKLVSNIFECLSVTVWLMDSRKSNFAFETSTFLSHSQAERLKLEPDDAAQVIHSLAEATGPVDLDESRQVWAALLRRLHPDEFRKGGTRVCAPLIASNELLGVIILGDRVGGVPWTLQDLDLLKCVSDQAASSLLNIQLSQRLSQAKQLEAFQAMSAFFVHDLKNTASTLSLMLQNLPVHFNDPEFRRDALRGISTTVGHINDLISRLSLLRQELAIRPVETDLNQLVTGCLNSLGDLPHVQLTKILRPLPNISLDSAGIQTVVTNLVLNAREAINGQGNILVETSASDRFVTLAVSDSGCGMSADFIQNSLFRPFKTTKKKGMGIGMFQCKMIVEAHNGRFDVESEPGKGTTFRVVLPLTK